MTKQKNTSFIGRLKEIWKKKCEEIINGSKNAEYKNLEENFDE